MSGLAHYAVADKLLAGPYPGTQTAVAGLEGAGVTLFVDLSHPSDPLDAYEPFLEGARRVAEPIPDMALARWGEMFGNCVDSRHSGRKGVTLNVSSPSSPRRALGGRSFA